MGIARVPCGVLCAAVAAPGARLAGGVADNKELRWFLCCTLAAPPIEPFVLGESAETKDCGKTKNYLLLCNKAARLLQVFIVILRM